MWDGALPRVREGPPAFLVIGFYRAINRPVVEGTLAAPFLSQDFLRNAGRVVTGSKALRAHCLALVVFDVDEVVDHAVAALDNLTRIARTVARSNLHPEGPP